MKWFFIMIILFFLIIFFKNEHATNFIVSVFVSLFELIKFFIELILSIVLK